MESKQYFTKGLKNGTSMWYSKKGQLVKEEKFINDKNVDITTYWHEIDTSKINLLLYSKFFSVTMDSARKINSKLTISATRFYNKKGELLRFNSFDQRGFKKNETIYFPKENREIHRYFHDNGMTSAEWNRVDNKDFGQYREWDKNGDLIKTWDYDKNGLQIKESIKIGKDLNRP
jgi:antitoxin component YwqK of YwqJK toxin-antitoxin module